MSGILKISKHIINELSSPIPSDEEDPIIQLYFFYFSPIE
jgi:hypothetical protein